MKPNLKFIHHGTKVYWNDPENADYEEFAEDHAATVYVVHSVNGSTSGVARESDDVILIYDPAGGYGEAEVPACELRPYFPPFRGTADEIVRHADAALLSMLRYADRRVRKAEAAERKALAEVRRLRAFSQKDLNDLNVREEMRRLRNELNDTRRRLAHYRDYYLATRQIQATTLQELCKHFHNTPDTLIRLLMNCPERQEGCADPQVAVVVEDANGQTEPISGAWYDPQQGMVRLSIENTFKK